MISVEGRSVTVDLPGGTEIHAFGSVREAKGRAEFAREALSWIGTPFRDCADVKGPNGAVDCAMLLTRCAVDTGLVAPFDPRPYPPRWHLHRDEERFVDWVVERFGAREVSEPRFGDLAIWMFGRCFSHGGVIVSSAEVVHAYAANGMVIMTRRDEPLLSRIGLGAASLARPVRYFDLWSVKR